MAETTLNLRITGDDAQAMQALLRMTQQQMKMARQMQEVGDHAGKAGRKIENMGGPSKAVADHFVQIGRGAAGMVSGLASLPAAIGTLTSMAEHLERIRDAQADITKRAVGDARQFSALQEQLGRVRGGDVGMQETVAAARAVAVGAGAPLAVGREALGSALSNLKGVSEAQAKEVATAIAGAVAVGGGGPEQAASIAELFGSAGITTGPQALETLGKMREAMLVSPARSLGGFGQMAQKGGLPLLTQGASLADVFALAAQTRQATSTEDQSAELLRQLATTVTKPDALKLIAREASTTPAKAKLLPITERIELLGRRIERGAAGDQASIEEALGGIEGEQRTRLLAAMSPAGRLTGATARERMAGASAAGIAGDIAASRERIIGRQDRLEALETERRIATGIDVQAAGRLRQEAQARVAERRQRGELSWWEQNKPGWYRTMAGQSPSLEAEEEGRILAERLGLPADTPLETTRHILGGPAAALQTWQGSPVPVPDSLQDLTGEQRERLRSHQKYMGSQGGGTTIIHNYGDNYDFAGRRDLTQPGENAPACGLD